MEKCIFIGYPEGYKGWLFYNPNTKRMVISERAEFDERYTWGAPPPKVTDAPATVEVPSTEHYIPGPAEPETDDEQDQHVLPESPVVPPVEPEQVDHDDDMPASPSPVLDVEDDDNRPIAL